MEGKLEVLNVTKSDGIKNTSNTSKGNFLLNFIKNTTMQNDRKSQNKSNFNNFAQHEEENKEKNNTLKKLLKNKQIKVVIIVLIFSLCALFILNSSFGTSLTTATSNKSGGSNFTSSLDYCEQLESKLKNVLNKINGAGNVSVMITVKGAPELIIASSSNEKTTTNSTTSGGTQSNTSISSDPVIVTNSGVSSPLILTEKLPEITGVVVVADGAKDVKVRLSLLQAVQALLQVKSSNIQIYY